MMWHDIAFFTLDSWILYPTLLRFHIRGVEHLSEINNQSCKHTQKFFKKTSPRMTCSNEMRDTETLLQHNNSFFLPFMGCPLINPQRISHST